MGAKTLTEIAELCGAALEGDGERLVRGPASLAEASPEEISFLRDAGEKARLAGTRAAAVLVPAALELADRRPDLALLRVSDPSAAFSTVVRAWNRELRPPARGVHPSAVVDASATIAADASIGPVCVIGPGARIGARAVLHSHCVIGEGTVVGEDTVLHARATLYAHVTLGARCILHSGVVLGADGFGFEPRRDGWEKIPHCGSVVVEDDVEIGANSTIDRGRFGATRIGRGAKIDNLVHVAHNVVVEEGALLCAQVGIAGSARVGRGAILGGQVGVGGHLSVGEGARLGGQAGVFGNVPAGVDYIGWPARPRRETLRRIALQNRLPELFERLLALESEFERARATAERDGAS